MYHSAVRRPIVPSIPELAHATVSNTVRSNIDHLLWEPCHNHTVPCQGCSTSVEVHHHAICRFLQSCSNVWRMTCLWWQLTHNITVHILRLSLKKGCFEINVEKISTFAGCHLATQPKSQSSRSRRDCLQLLLLFVLESSQYLFSPLP